MLPSVVSNVAIGFGMLALKIRARQREGGVDPPRIQRKAETRIVPSELCETSNWRDIDVRLQFDILTDVRLRFGALQM